MIKNSQIIRDYVDNNYYFPKFHPNAVILLACADLIDRLIVEREIAFTLVRLLAKENDEIKPKS